MRADWVFCDELRHILASLTPPNRLACEVSLATGLRIGDVLALRTSALSQRMTVREEKTGKSRRIYIPSELLERMFAQSGRFFVFEGRNNVKNHRTRQAIWKDLKRSAKLFRVKENIAPHTMRKSFAVASYRRTGDIKKVQALLNHDSEAVTMLYAYADVLTRRRLGL